MNFGRQSADDRAAGNSRPVLQMLVACLVALPVLTGLVQQPAAAQPTLTITPGHVSCTTEVVARGEQFEPGSQVVVSPGGVDAIPGSVHEPFVGPVTVSDDGTFTIEFEPDMWIHECFGGPLGRDDAPYQVTASTLIDTATVGEFGQPAASASFTFAVDPNDPSLTLTPDHGSGCVDVGAHGEHFEHGTVVTVFANNGLNSHTATSLGETDVADDGTFAFTLPPDATPFLTCGDVPRVPDGKRYLVSASTGQMKVGDGLRDPSAGAVFTVDMTPADHFARNWARTDKPVAGDLVDRTWMWGPEPFTDVVTEPYAKSPNGNRVVQYYDKARMEITDPDADPADGWYVTNGLLVTEMITGRMQVGDDAFEQCEPAWINVAGDPDGTTGPTYSALARVLDADPLAVGATITGRIDRDGAVTDDPALATMNVTVAHLDEVTNHAIASPFWAFMNATGTVWRNGSYLDGEPLFRNQYYATGRPITESYWATVSVDGDERDVLLQCFERRCLTYTLENPDGWQIEAGNVGRHYYQWRYGESE